MCILLNYWQIVVKNGREDECLQPLNCLLLYLEAGSPVVMEIQMSCQLTSSVSVSVLSDSRFSSRTGSLLKFRVKTDLGFKRYLS